MSILFIALALSTSMPGHAQAVLTDTDFNQQIGSVDARFQSNVQKTVEDLIVQHDIVGATVAIVVDGKLQAAVAAGKRKAGSPEPLLITDPMHTGSNTKGMTALLFGRLVDKGKLSFTQKIRDSVPYRVSADFADLPLFDFLTMRSGLSDKLTPDIFDNKYNPDLANRYRGPSKLYSDERQLFVKDSLKTKAGYPARSKTEYSSASFLTIGAIEEIVMGGTAWEDLMQTEVFKPLHMKAAGFGVMGSGKDVLTPWQHAKKNGAWDPIYHDNPRYGGPAGSVHCSAIDLANYAFARVVGAYGRGSFLSRRTWNTLQTPPEGGYACGIAVSGPDANGIRDMSHGGSNNLSCSDWWVRHHGRIIVTVMINCKSDDGLRAILDSLVKLTETISGITN